MPSLPPNAPSQAAAHTRSGSTAPFLAPASDLAIPLSEPFIDATQCARPHPDLIAPDLGVEDLTSLRLSDSLVDTARDGDSDLRERVAELEGRLAQRERQIAAMHRVSDALFAHVSMDDMVRETLALALEVTGAEAGSLQLYDATQENLVFRYVAGAASKELEGQAIPVAQGIGGRVFRSGLPDLTHAVHTDRDFNRSIDEATGFRTHSLMSVPVKRHDENPIGVMQVAHTRHSFDAHDLEVLSVLCDMAASAIEHARLQSAARQVQLISLLGDISHDIKNMLTPLCSGASTLRWLLDESFKRIDRIQDENTAPERALSNTLDVLRVVRSEYRWILGSAEDGAGRVQARTREIADAIKGEISPPYFECAPLADTIDEVMRSLAIVAQKAEVQLITEIAPAMPDAQHDRKMLYNALYNLVNNALAATPNGGTITVHAFAPDEHTACIEVKDTGSGMPEHVRARLFTEYAISTKPGGTGLGTRIVAGVVKRHHGTIRVQSEEGRGTTFTLKFPLVRCDE